MHGCQHWHRGLPTPSKRSQFRWFSQLDESPPVFNPFLAWQDWENHHPSKVVMQKNKIPGVYVIKHVQSGKKYVGSSANIPARWNTHRWELRKGVHGNSRLQNAWAKYGEQAFDFQVLEACDQWSTEIQLERETHWTELLKPEYNLCPTSMSVLGLKRSPKYNALRKANRVAHGLGCVFVLDDVWWFDWDLSDDLVVAHFDGIRPPTTPEVRGQFVYAGISKAGSPQYVLREDVHVLS